MTDSTEVARFYRTRKYTKVLGRFYDGTRIPGGPYSMTQGIVAAVLILVVIGTNPVWTTRNILFDLLLGGGVVYGVVWLAGLIRTGDRSPADMIAGLFRALTVPLAGNYNDAPLRIRRPHQVRGRVVSDLSDLRRETVPAQRRPVIPAPVSAPTPTPPIQPVRAVSAVERLRAQTTNR